MAHVKGMRVKVKPRKVMGDYVCLHGKVPNQELPKKLRGKIPKKEIWMRRDIYNNKEKRYRILDHEHDELIHMKRDKMCYKQAHKRAQIEEKDWFLKRLLK